MVADPLDQPDLVGIEWRAKRQQLIERRPQRVDVAAPIRLAPQPLGRHVSERSDQLARLRQVVPLFELGQAEVSDPDVARRRARGLTA